MKVTACRTGARTNCLSWFFSGVRWWFFFFFLNDCTKTFTSEKLISPLRIKTPVISPPHCLLNKQTNQKKTQQKLHILAAKKKKRNPKNKAELPWKLWIAACVLQAWWLKLHSAATSYRLPRLLKVCATCVPDLRSTRSPTMCLWHSASA